jgi:5-deoxy-glucuronate isomerase
VDYSNISITENTRGAYPIEFIQNAKIPCVAGHPTDIIFLTCDAFGVLPPMSSLSPAQAMYHFISGYTANEDAAPYAVYVPPRTKLTVTAKTDAELAVARSPAKGELPARLIEPAAMQRNARGKGANTRYVCDILPQDQPAESLLVVEVKTPSGNSSSYPPHKHDVDNIPAESLLEETYYHRIDPPQGFVFQRVYSDSRDIDESMAVEDRDVVLVPRGYHPVVVPHGYQSYYFNVMAGPKRVWHFHNDPAHEWILSAA